MTTATAAAPVLTVADRCDSCDAQGFVLARFATGTLVLCGHHFAEHEAQIRSQAFEIIDERDRI